MSGLPQEIIIDLTALKEYPKNNYQSFGIFCWHGYNSNPKLIEIQISKTNIDKNEFLSLGLYELEIKSGIQVFPIEFCNDLEDKKIIKYLKIIIKENYGEKWTYINQIMLYEKDAKNINNALKNSILYSYTNDDLNNSHDDIEEIEIEKISDKNNSNNEIELNKFNNKNDILKNNYELLLVENNVNKKNIEIKKINNLESIDKKYINRNKSNENNNKKSNKISKIEKILKRNILDNVSKMNKENNALTYQNTLNNMINGNQANNNLSDLSENKIFKKVFTNTPNRFIFNKRENIINNKDNDSININNNKRPYTPNIIQSGKYMNNNITDENERNNMELLKSKDYDNILKTQLKDMENQIYLLNNINISEVKSNCFNDMNQSNNKFVKTVNNNFYKKKKKDLNNEFIFQFNEDKNLNKTAYNKFYPNYNNIKNNNTINYNENQINNNIFCKEQNNNINVKKKNKFSTPPSNRMVHNYFQNHDYILNDLADLASNNEIDINRRLDILEININEIKKELNSMSHIISKITSGNFIKNIIKENVKLILCKYMNERNLNNFNNNETNNNRSFYSEILNEENKEKKIENLINQKIDKKLNNLNEEIKREIFNKYLRPSLNQIEINMKRNIVEIKDKIDEMNTNNYLQNYNNFKYTNYKNKEKQKELSEISSNNDIFSKSSSKLRNDKYEEINKLGEKLYQKLLEKEKKLKLLKKETSKFLED